MIWLYSTRHSVIERLTRSEQADASKKNEEVKA
jgi:hypothetical protein